MPISSYEIAQIIGQQDHAFRMMFGSAPGDPMMRPAGMGGSFGGFSIDPTSASFGQTKEGLATGAVTAAGVAASGMTLAADFGMAPSVLSPFSGTLGAAQAGFRAAGMAGGVGLGAAAFGAYAGAASILSPAVKNMGVGAQQYGQLSGVMGSMYGGGGGMAATAMLQNPYLGSGSLAVLQAAHQAGALPTSGDAFGAASAAGRFAQTASNVSPFMGMNEAMSAIGQLTSTGVSHQAAPGLLQTMLRAGPSGGMNPMQGFSAAQQGTAIAAQVGIDIDKAARDSFMTAAVAQRVIDSGRIPGLDRRGMDALDNATSRFLSGRLGTQTLAAAMDPETGTLDVNRARDIGAGVYSGQQIRSMAERNLSGNRDMFYSSRGELAGQFMTQVGAAGVGGAVQALTEGSSMQNTRMQQATGLNGSQLDQLMRFGNIEQDVRGDIERAAKTGIATGMQNRSLTDIIRDSVAQLKLGVSTAAQGAGRAIYQGVESAFGEVSSALYGGGMSGGASGPTPAQMSVSGDASGLMAYNRAAAALGPSSTRYGAQVTELGRAFIPPAFRLAGMDPGTSPGDLPFNGMALARHNPVYSGIALTAGAAALGFNAPHMLGRATSAVGRGTQALLGGRGLGKMAGLPIRGVGAGMRGVGNMLGMPLVAAGIIGADLAINEAPEILRRWGLQDPSYDITGVSAGTLRFLDNNNLVEGGTLFQHMGSRIPSSFGQAVEQLMGDSPVEQVRSKGGMFVQPGDDEVGNMYITKKGIGRAQDALQDLMSMDVDPLIDSEFGGPRGLQTEISGYVMSGMSPEEIQKKFLSGNRSGGLTRRQRAAIYLQRMAPSGIGGRSGITREVANQAAIGFLEMDRVGELDLGVRTLSAEKHKKVLDALKDHLAGMGDSGGLQFAELINSVNRRVGRPSGRNASNVVARQAELSRGLRAIGIKDQKVDGEPLNRILSGALALDVLGSGSPGGVLDTEGLSKIPDAAERGPFAAKEEAALSAYDRRALPGILGYARDNPLLNEAVGEYGEFKPHLESSADIDRKLTEAMLSGDYSPEELADMSRYASTMFRSASVRGGFARAIRAAGYSRSSEKAKRDPLKALSGATGITRRTLGRMFRKEDLAVFETGDDFRMTSRARGSLDLLARQLSPEGTPGDIESTRLALLEYGQLARAGKHDEAARALQRAGIGTYSGETGTSANPHENMARLSREADQLAGAFERMRANIPGGGNMSLPPN